MIKAKKELKRPVVSIVIPTYKRNKDLIRLLKSIKKSDYPVDAIEVIVVDNAANPKLKAVIKKAYPNVITIPSKENIFSNGARRLGSDSASGDYIFLLDDDNVLEKDCLSILVEAMRNNPKLGMVGPLMLDSGSSTIWSAGARLSSLGTPYNIHNGHALEKTHLPEMIFGIDYFPNAFMVRRSILKSVPFDDKTFPHNWAETDFSFRIIDAGYQLACVTAAIERHYIGYKGMLTRIGIEKTYDQAKSRLLFRRRFLSSNSDWIKFWVIIFPPSTLLYLWRIMRSPKDRVKILNAYMVGTYDGLFKPLNKMPRGGKYLLENEGR